MGLPIKLSGVHYYRISGRYTFAGDLFIDRGTLYFFPEVDLEKQRSDSTRYLPHDFALLVLAIIYLAQKFKSYASRNELWEEGITSERFQQRADAYISLLKTERSGKGFGESLPLPIRVAASEMANVKVGRTGRLSFVAQSDTHDFNIGLRRRRYLRDALWEAGLIKL